MGTKPVRLEEDVYDRVKAHKKERETFSEAIDRLIGGYSLLDFAGGMSEEAEAARERIHETYDEYEAQLDEELGI